MGVYYHGEEEVSVQLFSSGPYVYTAKPDSSFLCRQCGQVLDTPYRKRGTPGGIATSNGGATPLGSHTPGMHNGSGYLAQSNNNTNEALAAAVSGAASLAPPSAAPSAAQTLARTPTLDEDTALLLPIPKAFPVCHTCYLRIPSSVRPQFVPDKLMLHHLQRLLVLCTNQPNGCTAVVTRENLPVHLQTECPYTEVSCIFAKFGCATKVQRRELKGHEAMCPTLLGAGQGGMESAAMPYTLRELDRLAAIARDTQRRTRAMDSWMDEVDDALRNLSVDRDPEVLECYRQRLFERTVVVPSVPYDAPAGTPLGIQVIDMRRAALDLSRDLLPLAGILEVVESLYLNRCVDLCSLRIAGFPAGPDLDAVWSALARLANMNTHLRVLTLVLGADTVAAPKTPDALRDVFLAISHHAESGLATVELRVEGPETDLRRRVVEVAAEFAPKLLPGCKVVCMVRPAGGALSKRPSVAAGGPVAAAAGQVVTMATGGESGTAGSAGI
ncbi:TNF receptor-associated factor 3 [Blastocladiella emersonii ATCC 22665]|nr:TNF receptor-associated factor 3 [Blastocladiella emersonii ATCC 22665]